MSASVAPSSPRRVAGGRAWWIAAAWPWPLAVLLAGVTFTRGLWAGPAGTDYAAYGAQHAAGLLAAGDVAGFVGASFIDGASLLLRAPLIVAGAAAGLGPVGVYWLLALPAAVALVGLAVRVAVGARVAGVPTVGQVGAVVLVAGAPAAAVALAAGHAEEVLAGACAVAAVVFGGAPLVAGALLGVAVACKAWALVAIGPVILASRELRPMLLAAAAVAVPLLAVGVLAGGGVGVLAAAASSNGGVRYPAQLAWFVPQAGPWGRAVVAALGVGCAAGAVVARRRGELLVALPWLALLLLARCALDPWDRFYYHLPALLAVAAWEATRAGRLPWMGVAALLWLSLVFGADVGGGADLRAVIYVAGLVPLVVRLALAATGRRP